MLGRDEMTKLSELLRSLPKSQPRIKDETVRRVAVEQVLLSLRAHFGDSPSDLSADDR